MDSFAMYALECNMKYMSPGLYTEYRRYRDAHPDLPDFHPPMMNISDILRAYFILADYFGDTTADAVTESMLFGVRDMGLLTSALARQKVCFGGVTKYTQPLDICATLFYGIAKNHAFVDGNKRTALLTLLYQLDCYGYRPSAYVKEFERLAVAVAGGSIPSVYAKQWRHTSVKDPHDRCVAVISRLLKQWTTKKDNAFHISVTARDFIRAFSAREDCSCWVDGIKIKVQRDIKRKFWFIDKPSVVKSYSLPYRGDTRTIGAATIREALDTLDLYDQYPDYKSFFDGLDPRYMLIEQFEGPLRRLKDK